TGRPRRVAFSPHTVSAARAHVLSWLGIGDRDLVTDGVVILGKFHEDVSPAGVPVGGSSGFHRRMMADLPCYAAIPDAVVELAAYDARYHPLLHVLVHRRLAPLAALNPSPILLLIDRLRQIGPALVEDLRAGGVAHAPAPAREALA